MTVLRYLTLALAVAAMLWPAAPPRAGSGLAGTKWRIVEVDGARTEAGTLDFAEGKLAGRAACNRFFATFAERDGKLEFGAVGATRMLCAGKMELEQATFAALGKARASRRDGARLVLTADDGRAVMALEPAP